MVGEEIPASCDSEEVTADVQAKMVLPNHVKLISNNTNLPILQKEFMEESNEHYSKDEKEHTLGFLEDESVPVIQETLVKISGANVHLLDLKGSVSLARGDLSIVRLSQLSTGLAVFAKVGNDLSWSITKDGPIIKLNSLNYIFSVLVTSGLAGNESPQFEILNYGVTFTGEDETEEELKLWQKWLGYYGCLSGPKSDGYGFRCLCFCPESMDDVEEYWTRLGPCVKRYNIILDSAVAAGSGEIIQGMFLCSRLFLFRVQMAGKAIRKKAKAKGFIIKRTKVKGKHMVMGNKEGAELTGSLREKFGRAMELSKMVERMRENFLNGKLTSRAIVNGYVLGSEASNMLFSMLPPGKVLIASSQTMSSAFHAIKLILEAAAPEDERVYAVPITGRDNESTWNIAMVSRVRRNDVDFPLDEDSDQERLSVLVYKSKECVWRRGCERTCVLSFGLNIIRCA